MRPNESVSIPRSSSRNFALSCCNYNKRGCVC